MARGLAPYFSTSARLRRVFVSLLADVKRGVRHRRNYGARIRRASRYYDHAGGLQLQGARDSERRASRLYARVRKVLNGSSGAALVTPDRQAARAALSEATRPYRLLARALAILATLTAALALLVGLARIESSPKLRRRFFPRDLALNSTWKESSTYPGTKASGVGTASDGPFFQHTLESDHPWLEIDLGALHLVRSVLVENRGDCCHERALPLNVDAWDGGKWRLIAQRRAPFSTWKYRVGPVRTRLIRLQVAGNDYLHLKRVSIYGT